MKPQAWVSELDTKDIQDAASQIRKLVKEPPALVVYQIAEKPVVKAELHGATQEFLERILDSLGATEALAAVKDTPPGFMPVLFVGMDNESQLGFINDHGALVKIGGRA